MNERLTIHKDSHDMPTAFLQCKTSSFGHTVNGRFSQKNTTWTDERKKGSLSAHHEFHYYMHVWVSFSSLCPTGRHFSGQAGQGLHSLSFPFPPLNC
mmetsp:Transcript_34355/g.67919  ORF Transcript_34355/g.67919 Transcript_34355/m.67919 type:complete len:97 (-) Transcript_34355:95-385(-)